MTERRTGQQINPSAAGGWHQVGEGAFAISQRPESSNVDLEAAEKEFSEFSRESRTRYDFIEFVKHALRNLSKKK